MQVEPIDERQVGDERLGAAYVVFVYRGGDAPSASWSVDSHLLSDTSLVEVLGWLGGTLPAGSCWALGLVLSPAQPTVASSCEVAWVVGADVLNIDPRHRTPAQQRTAGEMLARRHRTSLP